MKTEQFNDIVEAQIKRSTDTLIKKAGEYATDDDRLHNFKVAAKLQGVSLEEACGGFLAKHIVSIYDMIRDSDHKDRYPMAQWDEKIGDAINYLLLLRAIVDANSYSEEKTDIEELKAYIRGNVDADSYLEDKSDPEVVSTFTMDENGKWRAGS